MTVCGGCFTESFLLGLFKLVKIDNPRVVDLRIELMHPSTASITSPHTSGTASTTTSATVRTLGNSTCALSPLFLSGAADLLSDYFNYCLPGLRHLCLHGFLIHSFILLFIHTYIHTYIHTCIRCPTYMHRYIHIYT